jgi:hypothetical protein
LKFVKMEYKKLVSKLLFKMMLIAIKKTQLLISFISLMGMEWIKASLVGMDLSNKS